MKLISSQKRTLASNQKLAALLIALAIVLLVITLFIVNYIVSIDTFTDLDGTEYTVKRQDGVYALFDSNGYMLDAVTENGNTYYLTDLGTMVSVSTAGDTEIYAVVDSEDGESVSDYNRLMIYPRIQVSDIKTIRVSNEYGSFTFDRDKNGTVGIKDYEDTAYDQELFAYLQSVCGNTTVMQKISTQALEQYGFEEYGLDEPRATITVTTSSGKKYVLHVGKEIVSGNGYYVRLVGRDTVYIFNTYIGKTALVPIETYVSPVLAYPVTSTNYMFIHNFVVNRHTYSEDGTPTLTHDIALTYWEMSERENTEFKTQAYQMMDPDLMAYTPSSDAVYSVMNPFITMDYVTVKKLGVTDEALKQYGLDNPAKSLYYEFETTDADGNPYYLKNYIYVSALNENGTYYATATVYGSSDKTNYKRLSAYDQIVEADRAVFPFMEWTTIDWVQKDYFQMDITVCDELEFVTPDYHVTFDIVPYDNSGDGKADDVEVYLVQDGDDKKLEVNNFKTLYLNLLGGKLFATADISEEEMESIIADESRLLLTWTVRTTTGSERTYSYYWLAESKTLLTVNGTGEFYVLTSAVEKTIEDAINVANGIKITAVSPYTNIDK